MQHKIYAVYDSKVGAYLSPFFLRSRGEAIRAWQTVVNDPKTQFNKHPSDYVLFELGEFDDAKATFNLPTPQSLGVALEFVKNEPPKGFAGLNSLDLSAGSA